MMKKISFGRLQTIGIMLLVSLLFLGCSESPKSIGDPIEEECMDCGEGGWEIMDLRCEMDEFRAEGFIECLSMHTLGLDDKNVSDVEEGYIVIGRTELLTEEVSDSIYVLYYGRWAVDKEGNMYLNGVLG